MALVKGTNSYVTLVEAESYFATRLDVAAWVAADNTQKEQALITASKVLDDLAWTGTAISESQPLAFPRNGVYFDPRLGTSIVLDGSIIPDRIATANCELAYHLLNNDGLLDDTGGVLDLELPGVKLSRIQRTNLLPAIVRRQINPLLVNQGSRGWWRAN